MAADILASDREREAVATRLRIAGGEGRLEPDELEARLERAYSARTRSALARLVEDLPAPAEVAVPARRPYRRVAAFLAVNAGLVGIWMAEVGARDRMIHGDSEFFWPAVPIVGWGAVIVLSVRRRRRRIASAALAR
jgi:Domain of unknown function (DUF1707)